MILAPLLASALLSVTPSELESAARQQVSDEYERIGRRTPVMDDALSVAARRLAERALEANARAATDLVFSTEALSQAGLHDASPRILVIKGAPADEPLRNLKQRKDLASESATHLGVGAVVKGDASTIVLLLSQRKMRLQKFARSHPAPVPPRELCGTLEASLGSPEVVITRPSGQVDRVALSKVSSEGFCSRVPFPDVGRYTVEVLAKGSRGPEVAGLFFVDIGPPRAVQEHDPHDEPSDLNTARAMIVDRINALRVAHGAGPLTIDSAVASVAQAYSEQMAREHFFAHVSPDGTTVGQRLRAAGYVFRQAGENLGLASGPMGAHFGIEHSPGHRKNLLEPMWKRVGIGIAEEVVEGSKQIVVTEVFVDPAAASSDPLADAYGVINGRRAQAKLPALKRNMVLEELARDHARRALRVDEPKAEVDGSKLHERVFDALDDVKSASIDFFVADSPSLIDATRASQNASLGWVGVGAVRGDSAKYGKDKYWVVVIYASPR